MFASHAGLFTIAFCSNGLYMNQALDCTAAIVMHLRYPAELTSALIEGYIKQSYWRAYVVQQACSTCHWSHPWCLQSFFSARKPEPPANDGGAVLSPPPNIRQAHPLRFCFYAAWPHLSGPCWQCLLFAISNVSLSSSVAPGLAQHGVIVTFCASHACISARAAPAS